jgi:hypothetical protein
MLALTDREAAQINLPAFHYYLDPTRERDPEQVRYEPKSGLREFQSLKDIGRSEVLERLKPYQGRGELLVKHFPTGMLTLGGLIAYLDMLEQVENFKPDMVLLDYMTLMHLGGRDASDFRISVGQLGRSLRGLAEMRNLAMVTVLQSNRASVGRKWISGAYTAEDWSLVGTSDIFLTYNQTPFERDTHVARVLVDKARNAAAHWSTFLIQAYEIGQFCTDSVFMGDVKDQLDEQSDD